MITMFLILAIVFGLIGIRLTFKFFMKSMNSLEVSLWIFAVFVGSFCIGIITAGNWHNATTFFTG